ncbi:MAG: D-alanyl-D-alanine carboxypeptidase/D-alanyl-D-alanine endopeptidase [Stenotrophobium sp.]
MRAACEDSASKPSAHDPPEARYSVSVPYRLVFTVSAALLSASALATPSANWSSLAHLQEKGASVTALAVDLGSGETLASINPDTRLTPASVTKLVTAAAALDHWPADKTFVTRLYAAGPYANGRLDHDLILAGAGDPSLDDQGLWSLATQFKGTGITVVNGNLVVQEGPFGPVGCETEDRCKALKLSDTAYNAPLSSIGVDFGNWCVEIRPTLIDAPAQVRGCGLARLPIAVNGSITTVASSRGPSFWVERITDGSGDSLRVGGNVPDSGPVRVYRAMSSPATGTGQVFGEMLREIGVSITGSIVVRSGPTPDTAIELANFEGMSLRSQLWGMLRNSNNYIADVLTLNMASNSQHSAPSLADAGRSLASFVSYTAAGRGSQSKSAPILLSGSGLTPENLISARDLVTLLNHEYRDTRNFPAFYAGLVVPRQAPFLFLRMGNADWLDRVALKTGTLEDPHSVLGLAGYLRRKDGGFIAFALIVNGNQRRHHIPLYESMEAARTDIQDMLARY